MPSASTPRARSWHTPSDSDAANSDLDEIPFDPPTLESLTAVVHLQYDHPGTLPVCPESWTRFVCISDTHCRTFPVPDGDVLLHSGDLTNSGTVDDFRRTMEWLYSLPHKHKIIICGNHDLTLHRGWYDENFGRWHRQKQDYSQIIEKLTGPKALEAGIVYLEDSRHEFKVRNDGRTWTVWGSPWQPEFGWWAFNYERGSEAERIVGQIPNTDILLTHGPPFEVMDKTITRQHVGCEALAERLNQGSLRPRLHVFGHIHETHGAQIRQWTPGGHVNPEQTVFVNAANWPMGPRAERGDPFGGGCFQPVVVDMLDVAS